MMSCIPARYMYSALMGAGMLAMSVMRLSTSMGIVAMVNHTALGARQMASGNLEQRPCPGVDTAPEEDGPFVWSQDQQGTILSGYFMGYIVTQWPGALLSQHGSAKWVVFTAIAGNIACCLCLPCVAQWLDYQWVVAVRVVQGLFSGMMFPSVMVMTARWAPPNERSIISGIIYGGFSLGMTLTNLVTGLLAKHMGWAWVFYSVGIAFAPWCCLWTLLAADYPVSSKYITEQELGYILSSQGEELTLEKRPFPWREVRKSIPFWTLLFCMTCNDCAGYMAQTYTPKFMKDVLHRDLQENAIWSTLPYFLNCLVSLATGTVADYCRRRNLATTTTVRQILVALGSLIPAFCLCAIGFIGCNDTAGIAFMTICIAALGSDWVGIVPNHIDLSPNYGGLLMGMSNTATAVPAIVTPVLIGKLTMYDNSLRQWSIAFNIVAVILIIMCIVYCLFGSGEVQPWNNPKEKVEVASEQQQPHPSYKL